MYCTLCILNVDQLCKTIYYSFNRGCSAQGGVFLLQLCNNYIMITILSPPPPHPLTSHTHTHSFILVDPRASHKLFGCMSINLILSTLAYPTSYFKISQQPTELDPSKICSYTTVHYNIWMELLLSKHLYGTTYYSLLLNKLHIN